MQQRFGHDLHQRSQPDSQPTTLGRATVSETDSPALLHHSEQPHTLFPLYTWNLPAFALFTPIPDFSRTLPHERLSHLCNMWTLRKQGCLWKRQSLSTQSEGCTAASCHTSAPPRTSDPLLSCVSAAPKEILGLAHTTRLLQSNHTLHLIHMHVRVHPLIYTLLLILALYKLGKKILAATSDPTSTEHSIGFSAAHIHATLLQGSPLQLAPAHCFSILPEASRLWSRMPCGLVVG